MCHWSFIYLSGLENAWSPKCRDHWAGSASGTSAPQLCDWHICNRLNQSTLSETVHSGLLPGSFLRVTSIKGSVYSHKKYLFGNILFSALLIAAQPHKQASAVFVLRLYFSRVFLFLWVLDWNQSKGDFRRAAPCAGAPPETLCVWKNWRLPEAEQERWLPRWSGNQQRYKSCLLHTNTYEFLSFGPWKATVFPNTSTNFRISAKRWLMAQTDPHLHAWFKECFWHLSI